jgi:hypothetical protein
MPGMADSHDDPNAAPMHHDIRERFAMPHVILAYALGLVATAAGIIFGIVLAND